MPIYEYKCNACQQNFDKLQRMNDETIPECKDCNSAEDVVRLISTSTSFQLKGTGWYETDFKRK